MTTLYQFAGSLYCEIARWALDYKKVTYKVTNLIPGPHMKTVNAVAESSQVPLLVDGEKVVRWSAAIVSYLDTTTKWPLLTPNDPEARSMAHEWERYLDRNVGVPLLFCSTTRP